MNPNRTSTHPAHALKPGDRIYYDFRGSGIVGEVEVFDVRPVNRSYVKLVMIDAGGRYHYRQCSSTIEFAVR